MDQHSEITLLRLRVSQLEREKEAVEGFAAVAAHELLTPMVMIDACAATIHDRLDGVRDAESLRDLDTLRRGAAPRGCSLRRSCTTPVSASGRSSGARSTSA